MSPFFLACGILVAVFAVIFWLLVGASAVRGWRERRDLRRQLRYELHTAMLCRANARITPEHSPAAALPDASFWRAETLRHLDRANDLRHQMTRGQESHNA